MKNLILLFNLIVCTTINLYSQSIEGAVNAEAAGMSTEKLTKIDREMNLWIDKGWMNGGVALIIRNGKVAYYKAVGYNDLDTKELMKKEGIFRNASQTKAITSVAIMMLYEDGKLLLDEPVSKYIPTFKKQTVLDKFNEADTTYTTVPANREITLRDLLSHTSGIGYPSIGSKEAQAIYAKNNISAGLGEKNKSLFETMSRLGTLPLMHQPSARFTYGLNTDVLGCIVEIVSGMSLEVFFKTRIFEPLGMNDSYFNLPAEKASRLVNMYAEEKDGSLKKPNKGMFGSVSADYPLQKHSYFSGGAGLSSPIMDYAKFLQMLLNNGKFEGKQLLSRNSVRIMTTNQIGDIAFNGDKFGLGFRLTTEASSGRNLSQEGTFSWGGAFSTSYWVDPKEKMIVLFYRQLYGSTHGELVEKFRALTYQAITD